MPTIVNLLAFYVLESSLDELLPKLGDATVNKFTSWFAGSGEVDTDGLAAAALRPILENYEAVWKATQQSACAYSYPQWASALQRIRRAASRMEIDVAPYPSLDQATYASMRAACSGEHLHSTAPVTYKAIAGVSMIGMAIGALYLIGRR